jgi:hypothetical protein
LKEGILILETSNRQGTIRRRERDFTTGPKQALVWFTRNESGVYNKKILPMKNYPKHVNVKVYETPGNGFVYPESKLDQLKSKKNVGICFSGGGTRSASLTMGQLRGLEKIGVLKDVKYLSAVSGGSWGSVPFVYLDSGISDEELLGAYSDPKEISLSKLAETPECSLSKAISNSKLLDDILKEIFQGDEMYSHIIANIFLKPFNLGDMKKFFTYDEVSLREIVKNNPELSERDFYLVNPRANRPYLIAGGTILRPNFGRYPFEMTPLYVGTYKLYENVGSHQRYDIGGGYVQSFGFDSDAPQEFDEANEMGRCRLGRSRHRFALGDMIGTSGAAPAEYAERFGLEHVGFPEFKYWSPYRAQATRAKEYDFADGGILENFGIMPLLKRGVPRIIVFVNCETELKIDPYNEEVTICDSIPALFKPIKNQYGDKHFEDNVVFADQEEAYRDLVFCLHQKIQSGEPAIHVGKYKITAQPHYDIKGGKEVEIMWVYNSRVKNWMKELPHAVRAKIEQGDYGDRFPNYKTFMENFPRIIDLKPEQVNLMAHQAAWNMVVSKQLVKDFVNGVGSCASGQQQMAETD